MAAKVMGAKIRLVFVGLKFPLDHVEGTGELTKGAKFRLKLYCALASDGALQGNIR